MGVLNSCFQNPSESSEYPDLLPAKFISGMFLKCFNKQPIFSGLILTQVVFSPKGEFQICPRMDLDNILYVEYLPYTNYKNEIILFLERCKATGGHLDVHPLCTNI